MIDCARLILRAYNVEAKKIGRELNVIDHDGIENSSTDREEPSASTTKNDEASFHQGDLEFSEKDLEWDFETQWPLLGDGKYVRFTNKAKTCHWEIYTTKEGDTLEDVASMFNANVDDILGWSLASGAIDEFVGSKKELHRQTYLVVSFRRGNETGAGSL